MEPTHELHFLISNLKRIRFRNQQITIDQLVNQQMVGAEEWISPSPDVEHFGASDKKASKCPKRSEEFNSLSFNDFAMLTKEDGPSPFTHSSNCSLRFLFPSSRPCCPFKHHFTSINRFRRKTQFDFLLPASSKDSLASHSLIKNKS